MTTTDYKAIHMGWLQKMVKTLLKSGVYKKEEITELAIKLGRYADDPIEMGTYLTKFLADFSDFHENLAGEIEEMVVTTEGNILTTDVYNRLHLTTREEKKNACVILLRLEKKGLIAKTGVRSGEYRKIVDAFIPLKTIDQEDTEPLNVRFPLGIHKYARIFQSNIIIVAGEKDCGKTGFCLNFATQNTQQGRKIRYISSEFGAAELKDRLASQDIDVNDWLTRVEFGQFQRNEYQDAILPDGINIIDFMENSDGKFYLVSEQIKKIYQNLRSGIALIALQKKKGQEYARGGELSAEKSRLYVTLSRRPTDSGPRNFATILHCKNRAMKEVNPNGLTVEYKLGGGFFFKQVGHWLPE